MSYFVDLMFKVIEGKNQVQVFELHVYCACEHILCVVSYDLLKVGVVLMLIGVYNINVLSHEYVVMLLLLIL